MKYVNPITLYIAVMLGSSAAYYVTMWFNPNNVAQMPYAEFVMRITPAALAIGLIIWCVKQMVEYDD